MMHSLKDAQTYLDSLKFPVPMKVMEKQLAKAARSFKGEGVKKGDEIYVTMMPNKLFKLTFKDYFSVSFESRAEYGKDFVF